MARFSLRNLFAGRQPKAESVAPHVPHAVGARDIGEDIKAYDNASFTYSGDLADVDFASILRDKQGNINNIYSLSDYFTDANPIVHGINMHVYAPFINGDYFLTCDNEKTIEIYEEHYKQIRLRELISDIAVQLTKYANVFVYKWNGYAMTLPPNKCVIANISIDGTPVVDFDVQSIQYEFKQRFYSLLEQKGINDAVFEDVLNGYPPEVAEAIKKGTQYARLDPSNTFVIQGDKEGWKRYAIPWIVSAFPALAKRDVISKYEDSLLNVGARPFIHATYGDSTKNQDILPDIEELRALRQIVSSAMSGRPLAVTNHLVKITPIQFDLGDLYNNPLYTQVNNDVLAAGGIAGIIVNGNSEEGSTFASAQVSMQAAACRIENARKEIEDFMLKFNRSLAEDLRATRSNNLKSIPEFHFTPLSMNGQKELREACEKLWTMGVVSTKTMMNAYGYSINNEKMQREKEADDGTDEALKPRETKAATQNSTTESDSTNHVGRPKMDDEERNSDPENAIRSKQAKDAEEGTLE